MDSETPQPIERTESSIGAQISIAVVVVLFVFGGLYFLLHEYQRFTAPPVEENFNA